MTGEEIKTMAESLIDDSIESTLFYQLYNVAKDNIEDDREWEILKAFDSSQTAGSSDNYLTMKTLPSDFRTPLGYLFLGTDRKYTAIPYTERISYKDRNGYFYVDYANSQYALMGSPGSSMVIHLPYIKTSAELTNSTEWGFPSRFHKILAFMVAGYYTAGVDVDDIYARMSPEHKLAAQLIMRSMEQWNNKLALSAQNMSATLPLIDYGTHNFNFDSI